MILVLLDTNSYLRLAKRVRPAIGIKFGIKEYVLTVHKSTEDEVRRSPRLRAKFPWFDDPVHVQERLAKQLRLSAKEHSEVAAAKSVLHTSVIQDPVRFMTGGRSPPSDTDCYLLALGQVKPAVIVTGDLGMHLLANDFNLPVWHGHELLRKLQAAKIVDKELIREIFDALETNKDLPATWLAAKHTVFAKIFGNIKL